MCRRETEDVSSESTFEMNPPRVHRYSRKWQKTFCTIWSKIYNAIFLFGLVAFLIWVLKIMFHYYMLKMNPNYAAVTNSSLIKSNASEINMTSFNVSDVFGNGSLQFWNDIGMVNNRNTNGTIRNNSTGWENPVDI